MNEETEQKQNVTEFYLATVVSGDATNGYKLQFAGESSAKNKSYQMLKNGTVSTYSSGTRVVVMKISGTYIVLGRL